MNKNEIKLNIAQSFEAGNRALFTKSALEYAALIDSVKELNEFTEFIFNKQVHSGIDDIEKKELLKEIIKDKIFELIIAKGDTPSRNYLLLYDLYKEGEGLEDARLDKYINFIDENVKSQKYGDMERIYFAHLRFLLSFMRGDKDSFKQFLKNILTLNIHQLESASEVAFIREFIAKMEIGLEEFFETFREILAPEYYFSLSYGERRSMFNWAFHCLWNVPKLFNDRRWMELYPLWKAIFYGHLERGEMDEALYVHFYIYHKMGNSFHTQTEWRMFNEEISRYASRYYIEWAKNHNLIEAKKEERKEGKKLIGILKDRIVENAPFKVEYSVLEPMMKDESFTSKYDVKIYNMNYIEKSDSSPEMMALFQKIGIEIIDAHQPFYTQGYYFSHLQKALYLRQKMIDDGVDIMIVACNGYDISDFIVATRAAPKQIFWCHGNFEYDIPGIDKRITHIDKNTPQKQSDYLVEHFDFESDERYLGLDEERFRAEADKVRARFPEGTVILGAIGRLVKVDSKEYLEAVAKIMKECPNTVYLACGTGNVDSVQKQVEELGIGDRFYFEGWVDPDIYGYVIDVYLDTFPERGGMSVVEWGRKNYFQFITSYNSELSSKESINEYVLEAVSWVKIADAIGRKNWFNLFEMITVKGKETIKCKTDKDSLKDAKEIYEKIKHYSADRIIERIKPQFQYGHIVSVDTDNLAVMGLDEFFIEKDGFVEFVAEAVKKTSRKIVVINAQQNTKNLILRTFSHLGLEERLEFLESDDAYEVLTKFRVLIHHNIPLINQDKFFGKLMYLIPHFETKAVVNYRYAMKNEVFGSRAKRGNELTEILLSLLFDAGYDIESKLCSIDLLEYQSDLATLLSCDLEFCKAYNTQYLAKLFKSVNNTRQTFHCVLTS